MKRILVKVLLALLFCSCGRNSDRQYINAEHDRKRPLKLFSEDEVVRHAVVVFTGKSEHDFLLKKIGSEFVVTSQNGSDSGRQYVIKIGADGLVLNKDEGGNWTDRFKDRRIFYYEENNKLILSEVFDGDSTTFREFAK